MLPQFNLLINYYSKFYRMSKIINKTPITYYGGKQKMLKNILPLIPPHEIYIEAFAGGAAVFWAKEPVRNETLNDLNGEVANFYKILKTDFLALQELVQTTMHSRQEYQDAVVIYKNPHLFDELKRAWAFWVSCNQSFSSSIGGGWAYNKKRKNTRAISIYNKRTNFLCAYTERLEKVSIENKDAVELIRSRDIEKAFFYIDPPYHNATQGHYAGYKERDFEDLLKVLIDLKANFLLSSYPSGLLKKYVKENNWYQKSFESTISATTHRRKKVEVLTANYEI